MFNIIPTPTVLQLTAWLTYLVVVVALFLRTSHSTAKKPATSSAATPQLPAVRTTFRKVSYMIDSSAVTAPTAVVVAILAGVSLAGCTAKNNEQADSGGTKSVEITVEASDTACTLSADRSATGKHTFVITNNGTKVTEFYLYGKDNQVLAEAENISPGVQRKLDVDFAEPGTYQTACKPGMVGDGIRAKFTVAD